MNKKSDKANLEKSKGLFYTTGFAVVLLLAFLIIEHKEPVNSYSTDTSFMGEPEFMGALIIIEEKIEMPPPKNIIIMNLNNNKNNEEVKNSRLYGQENLQENYGDLYGDYQPKSNKANYIIIDEPALFPGGERAMNDFIKNNVQYPESARKNKPQGRVYVNFTIEKDGRISKPKIVNSSHSIFNKEALRLINSMPLWQPAQSRGEPVRSSRTISIVFKL